MLQARALPGVLVVSLLLINFLPTAAVSAPRSDQSFYVNVSSFTSNLPGQGDPLPTIINGARAWSTYGGSSTNWIYSGNVTNMGCGSGSVLPHIWMSNTCPWFDPSCAGGVAWYQGCAVSGFTIYLLELANPLNWRLTPTSTAHSDVQSTVTHEIGHAMGLGHIDPADGTACCMSSTNLSPNDAANRYFCREELDLAQAGSGCYSTTPQISTNTSFSQTTWTAGRSLSTEIGLGLGDLGRGIVAPSHVRDTYFRTQNTCGAYSVGTQALCDYRAGGIDNTCSGQFTSVTSQTPRIKPTIVYDTNLQQWWRFTVGDSGTTRDRIEVWSSPDRATWTSRGMLAARTRVPVAAAFDSKNNIIVAVVNQYSRLSAEGFPSPSCPAGGCAEDLVLYKILPATGTFVAPFRFAASSGVPAYAAFGGAAVACTDAAWTRNCVVMGTSKAAARNLFSFSFGVDGTTNHAATTYSAVINTAGTTNAPPSLTQALPNPNLYNNHLVAVVVGSNGDRSIYSASNDWWFGTWSSWLAVSSSGVPLQTTLAPVIRANFTSPANYDLLFAP